MCAIIQHLTLFFHPILTAYMCAYIVRMSESILLFYSYFTVCLFRTMTDIKLNLIVRNSNFTINGISQNFYVGASLEVSAEELWFGNDL